MQSKEQAHNNHHTGLQERLSLFFNQLLMSLVKGIGRGPQIEGLGWMPFPCPHQTFMQRSKTNRVCACPLFSLSVPELLKKFLHVIFPHLL